MATPIPPPAVTVEEILAELDALDDPKMRAVNERHGNDIGVNLSQLRAIAKRLKTQLEFAQQLWATGDSQARLVAILISSPKKYTAEQLDTMLRETRVPKVHDWFINYILKKNPESESRRIPWMDDVDEFVASAGWALTSHAVAQRVENLKIAELLDAIEAEMKLAPDRLQWFMNECLASIGIHYPKYRARAIEIGERLEVLKDYPTPPNCTSPYAPIWIHEMVTRNEGASEVT
ncbi:DNA alkylation repair protein [Enteractinococcus coprophilus]|uniref:3-methyladenine DNA glycosylase AlkD n=1 Tax=Enteractinococcus coprophilus TaxID=1027633 RepID=A0A543AML5_9MICC|nr:DNA alkylation repair protein [Enteractinococcus coprophilus]TQL73766.1 3-methyladenine DNA glycosylase AlkD [Enteractinococcus coprophilus]